MPLENMKPFVKQGVFIAPNASVIGSVELGEHSTVWYGAVLRGN
jgi:carbonic anhydrase/acetyltransferase-like protein (isoleucine patch superfamily)